MQAIDDRGRPTQPWRSWTCRARVLRFWLPETKGQDARDVPAPSDEDTRRREREALAELAERVNAARSIV